MKKHNILLTTALTAFTGFYALTGFAADEPAVKKAAQNWMPIAEVIQQVEAQGFTDIRSIERDDGGYKIKALNAEGKFVRLQLNRENAQIEKQWTKAEMKKENWKEHHKDRAHKHHKMNHNGKHEKRMEKQS